MQKKRLGAGGKREEKGRRRGKRRRGREMVSVEGKRKEGLQKRDFIHA